MAISWTPSQEKSVADAIEVYPPESNRCETLAIHLLPVARERDENAHFLAVKPKYRWERFIQPLRGPRNWQSHVAVGLEEHVVDALTGVPGTEQGGYLETHWEYPEALHLGPLEEGEAQT